MVAGDSAFAVNACGDDHAEDGYELLLRNLWNREYVVESESEDTDAESSDGSPDDGSPEGADGQSGCMHGPAVSWIGLALPLAWRRRRAK